jgi:hypothetical protein
VGNGGDETREKLGVFDAVRVDQADASARQPSTFSW